MQNPSRLAKSLAVSFLGIVLEVAGYCCWPPSETPRPGPDSMDEVVRIADQRGLYFRSDRHDGVITHRLVVSDRPITLQSANQVRFGAPEHPCWRGVVAVCFPAKFHLLNFDPQCSKLWGDTFLYGDPELIRRLTADEDPKP